jgi:hypothetical protein
MVFAAHTIAPFRDDGVTYGTPIERADFLTPLSRAY